ncbi:MAG: hypothetical protein GXP60_02390, partial [Epsilonproteobacteria bacterium]|nr:hypothetical protein [Campylobacterota bacterium]
MHNTVNSAKIISLSFFKLFLVLLFTLSYVTLSYGYKNTNNRQNTASIKNIVSDYNIGLIRAAKTGSVKSLNG